MADIDFITDLTDGFQISLSSNPAKVTGNRALLNRFEITFLTDRKTFYDEDGQPVKDNYGGNANSLIGQRQVLNNTDAMAASINLVIQKTVKSMKLDETGNIPNTEKIDKAELISINVVDDLIAATIRVYPVEVEASSVLEFNLPIIKRS